MKKLAAILALPATTLLIVGCGSSTDEMTITAPSKNVKVGSAKVAGLGPVLVEGEGRTLYVFVPDRHSKVSCRGSCTVVWPPLKTEADRKVTASGQVQPRLLGADSDPEGAEVVTYAGWPLYTYVSDTSPGKANGQALELNGGFWYVISPSGKVIYARAPAKQASPAALPPNPGGADARLRATNR